MDKKSIWKSYRFPIILGIGIGGGALLGGTRGENATVLKPLGDIFLNLMFTIVVPMVKPAILSIGIIFFINSWNEYVWPSLILKSTENYTLSLALQMFVSAEGGTDIPVAMAISVLTMLLPLGIYSVCQKYIINTFAQSGIKG